MRADGREGAINAGGLLEQKGFSVGLDVIVVCSRFDLGRRPHVGNYVQRIGEPNESRNECNSGNRGYTLRLTGERTQAASEIEGRVGSNRDDRTQEPKRTQIGRG